MFEKTCPGCGHGSAEVYASGISHCGACGLAWLEEKKFEEAVYAAGAEEDIYVSAKLGLFAQALKVLGKLAPGKGKLLDIGSAYGELLAAAEKAGWLAEGVEVSRGPAEAASKKGFKVYTRPVEELGLPENFYAAVTAFEVFSQMADPLRAAAELYRVLKPGGAIFIREFNASFHLSMRALERGGLPGGLRPSVLHNCNFSARSMAAMLEAAGFRDIKIYNSRPTAGDPYRTGGRLGGFLTGALKILYYWLAQALWVLTFGRVYAGSTLIATARK